MELNIKYQKEDGSPLPDPTMYSELAGSLIYLTMTQPNIAYVIQGVGQFVRHPKKNLLATVHHIL